jgi:hypothetical protein
MDPNRTISPSIAAFVVLVVATLVVGLYVSNIELQSGSAGTVSVTQAPSGETGQIGDETPSTAEEEPTEAVVETETEGAPSEEQTATPAPAEDEPATPTEEADEAADTDEVDVEDIVGDSVTVESATDEEFEEAAEDDILEDEDTTAEEEAEDAVDTEETTDEETAADEEDEETVTDEDAATEEGENRIQNTVSGLSVTVPEGFEAAAPGRFVTLTNESGATIELSVESPTAATELLGVENLPEEEIALNLLRQFAEAFEDAGEATAVSYGELDGAAVNILREVGDGERRSVRIFLLELPDGDLVFVNASADTVEFRDMLSDTLDTVLESLEVESGE